MVALAHLRQQGITIDAAPACLACAQPLLAHRWRIAFLGVIIMATGAAADQAIKELAPTGKLRVGIAVGPAASALWCVRDAAAGKARGVPVELGTALAQWL